MDLSTVTLALAVVSLALGGFAAARAYVPPQRRSVSEAVRRIDDLEHAVDAIEERITVRARKEGMAQARERHEVRSQRRQLIEEEAAEIIRATKQPPAARPEQLTKDQLRAMYLVNKPPRLPQ